jgi:parallel beta-helix repeat protein
VALLNRASQTFTGNNSFSNNLTVPGLVSAGATLGIGSSSSALNLAGTYSSSLAVTDGTHTATVAFTGVPTANVTYDFDVAAAAGTYTICTSVGNCTGVSGGAIGGSGTLNKLAKFTGSGFTIGDSILTDNGTTVSVAGTLNATTLQQGGTGVLLQSTAFSGDVSGAYNATSVDKLKGTALSIATLSDTNFLVYNSTSGNWENHSFSGDITVSHSGVATIGTGAVTSLKIADGTIANIDIAAGAAIDYSKLNLSGSITNSDISSSANISDSKLATITSAGKVADSALSSNVALLSRPGQIFTDTNAFQANSATAFQVQSASASETLFTVDTTARSVSGGDLIKIGDNTGTEAQTTILVTDSFNGALTSNLSALNGGLYYNSSTNHINVIENGTVKELCNKTDLGCGSSPTVPTSQTKVVAMGTATGCTGTSPVSSADTNADYVITSCTSAQTTINTAISAISSTGGTVYLKEGRYIIDGSINMASNVTLAGSGSGTIIEVKDGIATSVNAISASSVSRIAVRDLILDGNKTNWSSGTIRGINLNIVGSGSGTSAVPGVSIVNTQVRNFHNEGIYFTTTKNSSVSNSEIINNAGNGVETLDSGNTYINVTNNQISGNSGAGLYLLDGSYNVVCGNIIE